MKIIHDIKSISAKRREQLRKEAYEAFQSGITGHSQYGFFCPEAMSWMVDAPNLKLSRDITGFRLLPPGGRAVYTSLISIRPGQKS